MTACPLCDAGGWAVPVLWWHYPRLSHDLRVVWNCAIIVVVSSEVRGFPNGYPGLIGERIVAMRKTLEWFDGLAPNHMVWAVCTYGMAITMIVMFIHIVKL